MSRLLVMMLVALTLLALVVRTIRFVRAYIEVKTKLEIPT